jgi:hypothetical protein
MVGHVQNLEPQGLARKILRNKGLRLISFPDFIIAKSSSTFGRLVILDIALRHSRTECFFPPRLHTARFEILSQGCPSHTQPEENSTILWKSEAEDSKPVEEWRFQRRVNRPPDTSPGRGDIK